ncbi:unnamed protein product, partial [Amoebophrya sp. A25]
NRSLQVAVEKKKVAAEKVRKLEAASVQIAARRNAAVSDLERETRKVEEREQLLAAVEGFGLECCEKENSSTQRTSRTLAAESLMGAALLVYADTLGISESAVRAEVRREHGATSPSNFKAEPNQEKDTIDADSLHTIN